MPTETEAREFLALANYLDWHGDHFAAELVDGCAKCAEIMAMLRAIPEEAEA